MRKASGYQYQPIPENHTNNTTTPPPVVVDTGGWLGYRVLFHLSRDVWLLIISKAIRLFSYGFLAVMLVIYLESLQFSTDSIGLLLTLTLFGDAFVSILLTTHADRWGRRFTLLIGSAIAITTSFIFATQRSFFILLITGILGVISPSGSEIGPFMAIEISAITEVSLPQQRTALMAWYNLFGSLASAFGALTCGYLMDVFQRVALYDLTTSCSIVLCIYGTIQIGQFLLFLQLSPAIETIIEPISAKSSQSIATQWLGLHHSKWIVLQLSLLFMLDAFAGSFVLQSLLSAWFYETYQTNTVKLGMTLFYCNIVAGFSALLAVQIANMIGLILTMVVTHLPSNVLLILVPLMPNEFLAIVMICLRFSISQMDVPTRNAYVQGVVHPDERSAANGVTNVFRTIGASSGPFLCGMLLSSSKYKNYPFFIAGGLKIVYDLLLLGSFYYVKSDSDTHNRPAVVANNNEKEKKIEMTERDEEKLELIPK